MKSPPSQAAGASSATEADRSKSPGTSSSSSAVAAADADALAPVDGGGVATAQQQKNTIEGAIGLYPDRALNDYVASVGQRVAAKTTEGSALPWSFEVLDDAAVNAFALTGGAIFVTRGLLAYLGSEAELAAVLAHEIAHVTAHHVGRPMSHRELADLGFGAIMSGGLTELSSPNDTGLDRIFVRYGGGAESQADDLGLRYMTAAGYDPHAMVSLFEMLGRIGETEGRVPQWLSTHRPPADRAQAVRDQLSEISDAGDTDNEDAASDADAAEGEDEEADAGAAGDAGAGVDAGEKTAEAGRTAGASAAGAGGTPFAAGPGLASDGAYLRHIDGIIFGEDPRKGYFRGSVFYEPDLGIAIRFPDEWPAHDQLGAAVAASPDGRAAIELRKAGRIEPAEALTRFLTFPGVQPLGAVAQGTEGEVTSRFTASSRRGSVIGFVSFAARKGTTLRILGLSSAEVFDWAEPTLAEAMTSFGPIADPAALYAQPARLAVVTVPRLVSLREFNEEFPSTIPVRELALINHIKEDAQLAPGALLKRVVAGTATDE